MDSNLNNRIVNATKWSALTELLAKLVTPITSMVMARLLTPEAYGVVATFSIIISLADNFSEAGFQRYLVHREFKDETERDQCTNVAFWSNLMLSFIFWGGIAIFNKQLAAFVGSPGLGGVLIVTCAAIPLTGFCSIQMALFRRDFDFKTLFWRRLVSILTPFFVSIPLAFWLRNYWALVIGSLAQNTANAFLLSIKSNWRPRRFFSFTILSNMIGFCLWSLVDSILMWATSYADAFFIGRMLNTYYLGLYRTSISMVGQIVALITAVVLPVIMPSLSRLQNDIPQMRSVLLKFQKITGIILIPMGVGIFVFRYLITRVTLGAQWDEAADFLGLWGLMEAVTVIFARFCSPVYPAIGKPKISAIVQILHLVVLIPGIVLAGHYGFKSLYITRSLIRLQLVLINIIFVYIMIQQSPWKMFTNIMPEALSASFMGCVGYFLLKWDNSIVLSFIWIFVCILFYFMFLYLLFPNERKGVRIISELALNTVKRR